LKIAPKFISSMATKGFLVDIAAQYARETGRRVTLEAAGGVEIVRRVKAGEAVDVVVLAADAIDRLTTDGRIAAGSRVDLVKSGISVAVRRGAQTPDIGSEAALKRAVLAAKKLSYSTGPSGVYLEKLFARWGIAGEIEPRVVRAPPGVPVGLLIARGDAELGFQQLSELIHLQGIDVVGALPPEIQLVTTFSAGVSVTSTQGEASRAALTYMASPAAAQAKRKNGLDPA
jgi:molybdate transport system substrate-binding protein